MWGRGYTTVFDRTGQIRPPSQKLHSSSVGRYVTTAEVFVTGGPLLWWGHNMSCRRKWNITRAAVHIQAPRQRPSGPAPSKQAWCYLLLRETVSQLATDVCGVSLISVDCVGKWKLLVEVVFLQVEASCGLWPSLTARWPAGFRTLHLRKQLAGGTIQSRFQPGAASWLVEPRCRIRYLVTAPWVINCWQSKVIHGW